MSRSLALVNGDLAIGPGRKFEQVSGKDKLLQDLRLWVLEKIGIDPATPGYGSRLDGGTENGVDVPSFIGQFVEEQTIMEIRAEIIDLISRYQTMQYNSIRDETIRYGGPNTYTPDQVVAGIESVDVQAVGTLILAQVIINTLTGDTVTITMPVTGDING